MRDLSIFILISQSIISICGGNSSIHIRKISGCASGETVGLQDGQHPALAACQGQWFGHVKNASKLCAGGWHLCSSDDEALLQSISWTTATSLEGCFAINAAQDNGNCQPCDENIHQDDLAAIGKACPHQKMDVKSCITGGKVSASCCNDDLIDKACHYKPGVTDGVLCCKEPGLPPKILVHPEKHLYLTTGETIILTCQGIGEPMPSITWFKDKKPIAANISRISTFDSGYLVISNTQKQDHGYYTCVVENKFGKDSSLTFISIQKGEAGCADGTIDALNHLEGIRACQGGWYGHVKRGKSLCAKGWRVCSQRDVPLLQKMSWSDVTKIKGCYAYNAANEMGYCKRCHRGFMAGIGDSCGRIKRASNSCLKEGSIDVSKEIPGNPCSFIPEVTSGVLCCKRHRKKTQNSIFSSVCKPQCMNGGICRGNNRCECADGYKGAYCQNAICTRKCMSNAICVEPDICKCKPGYSGPKCTRTNMRCPLGCLNGGKCRQSMCKCPKTHWGSRCQHLTIWFTKHINRTQKSEHLQ